MPTWPKLFPVKNPLIDTSTATGTKDVDLRRPTLNTPAMDKMYQFGNMSNANVTSAGQNNASSNSYSGSGSSGASSNQSFDYGAYLMQMLAQQQAEQKRLRQQATQTANENVDRNAEYAVNQLSEDKEKQARNAYISREKSLNSLPQASLAMGGGGLSETSLLGINSGYENAVGELTDTFNRNKADILNQANNAKAQNIANETAAEIDFAAQMPTYLAQLASLSGGDSNTLASMVSALSGSASPTSTSNYATLKARGFSDEELRNMGLI